MNPDPNVWTLSRVVQVLRRAWLLIAAAALVGVVGGYGVAAATTPVYDSTASLYFALDQGATANDLNQGSAYTQSQMLSFAQLATSSRVLDPVIDELELDSTARVLARDISVAIPQDTVVLEVRASSTDPRVAAQVADAVTRSLVDVVREIAPTGPDDQPTVEARVIDDAVVPRFQSAPSTPLSMAVGLMAGLLLGVVAAITASVLDTRVRTPQALAEVVDRPVLGVVSRGGRRGGTVDRDPLSTRAEESRRLRSAISYASLDGAVRRIVVTSALPGEGKTTVAANLAYAFCDESSRALLVDADLRKPRIGDSLGIESGVGLTSVLVGDVPFETALQSWGEARLDVLTSGAIPPNPAQVLTSGAMRDLLGGDELSAYDVVVIDSPPVLSVADTTLLGPLVDGVVIVVDARRTRRSQVLQTVGEVEAAGATVLGFVLNSTRSSRAASSRYYREPVDER